VYHEVTADTPSVWIAFDVSEPQSLKVSLGVPYLERLKSYRPALALVGPGLPPADLPPGALAGQGGIVIDTRDVAEPEFFDEPFSGTQSWVVAEAELALPEPGRYYVVGYSPAGEEGKLWVALGVKEVFDAAALGGLAGDLADVREFHELSGVAGLPCLLIPFALAAAGVWLVRLNAPQARVRAGGGGA